MMSADQLLERGRENVTSRPRLLFVQKIARHRVRCRLSFAEHYLEKTSAVSFCKKEGGASIEIEAPHAPEILIILFGLERAYLLPIFIEIFRPCAQGLRIVAAQILDIQYFKTVLVHYLDGLPQTGEIPAGEYVAADEIARPLEVAIDVADEMQHSGTSLLQRARHAPYPILQLVVTGVFIDAERDVFVIHAFRLAEIRFLNLYFPLQSARRKAC